jgi:hypothetical protein
MAIIGGRARGILLESGDRCAMGNIQVLFCFEHCWVQMHDRPVYVFETVGRPWVYVDRCMLTGVC